MDLLETITRLSHEFGTSQYVKGGGGNTSAKSPDTLWVKPSGTTLAGLAADTFVALDRAKLGELYQAELPAEVTARESLVKDLMLAARLPGEASRPSVEAPLHD
ncbi:MAG: class II aldolase, partial [Xanthomonadales bacterium]|nr:class II aldolase [Xanthomonadales bacterium]